jgi:hypothetical protein
MTPNIKLSRNLTIRLACAAALLTTGMTVLSVGAQLGAVHLNAGDMKIVFGTGEGGLTLDVAARTCPPHCSFDIGWRPLAKW